MLPRGHRAHRGHQRARRRRLWGANAVNGVINIITRKSSDTQGGVLTLGAGNQQRDASLQYGGRLVPDLTTGCTGSTRPSVPTRCRTGIARMTAGPGRKAGSGWIGRRKVTRSACKATSSRWERAERHRLRLGSGSDLAAQVQRRVEPAAADILRRRQTLLGKRQWRFFRRHLRLRDPA